METTSLGRTGLKVSRICLGTMNFGPETEEADAHRIMDRAVDAGINFFDTANVYGWGENKGKTETIVGRWLAKGGRRDRVVLATKVYGAMYEGPNGGRLSAYHVRRACDDSLRRLQTDRIDLYYAHFDDQDTPLEETLRAFDAVVEEGIVRHIAASNYSPERLTAALELQRDLGLAEFTVLQPHYNLMERDFERTLLPIAEAWDLAVLPYYALAKGFLTGKYRPGGDAVDSPRAEGARAYLDRGGAAVLSVLDEIATAHETTVAAVALAWLLAQRRIVAPIASARTVEQLGQILPAANLKLEPDEIDRLSAAAG